MKKFSSIFLFFTILGLHLIFQQNIYASYSYGSNKQVYNNQCFKRWQNANENKIGKCDQLKPDAQIPDDSTCSNKIFPITAWDINTCPDPSDDSAAKTTTCNRPKDENSNGISVQDIENNGSDYLINLTAAYPPNKKTKLEKVGFRQYKEAILWREIVCKYDSGTTEDSPIYRSKGLTYGEEGSGEGKQKIERVGFYFVERLITPTVGYKTVPLPKPTPLDDEFEDVFKKK